MNPEQRFMDPGDPVGRGFSAGLPEKLDQDKVEQLLQDQQQEANREAEEQQEAQQQQQSEESAPEESGDEK